MKRGGAGGPRVSARAIRGGVVSGNRQVGGNKMVATEFGRGGRRQGVVHSVPGCGNLFEAVFVEAQ